MKMTDCAFGPNYLVEGFHKITAKEAGERLMRAKINDTFYRKAKFETYMNVGLDWYCVRYESENDTSVNFEVYNVDSFEGNKINPKHNYLSFFGDIDWEGTLRFWPDDDDAIEIHSIENMKAFGDLLHRIVVVANQIIKIDDVDEIPVFDTYELVS